MSSVLETNLEEGSRIGIPHTGVLLQAITVMHSLLATTRQEVTHLSHSGFNSTKINMAEQLPVQPYTYTTHTNVPFRDFLHKSSTQKRIQSFSSGTALLSFCNAVNQKVNQKVPGEFFKAHSM